MFSFLFKEKKEDKNKLDINEIYGKLKEIYSDSEISDERRDYLKNKINKYGYLPLSHLQALETLIPAEVIYGIEQKLIQNNVLKDGVFTSAQASVLSRNNIKDSDWLKKEGHDIKLINLSALGNGNVSDAVGKFIDWLRQLLILPAGNPDRGIFSTTIYLVPFHPREFGCAYLPISYGVSDNLEDSLLKEKINLDAKSQVQLFIKLAQLAGHPVIYDILPQTGRFAKVVLANPHAARWFDIKELSTKIKASVDTVAKKLEGKFDNEDIDIIKDIYNQHGSADLSEDYRKIYRAFEKELDKIKKELSNEMLKHESQLKLQKRVKDVVAGLLGVKNNKPLTEEDITNQPKIIKNLIAEGLWTAPGGAWCSAGVPVFDRMSECRSYPVFKHYDHKGADVTDFANLDCQTPFYFSHLERGQINKPVVDLFIKLMLNLQEDYNFDGFRVDHVDHIVDEVSQKNGAPISYRIPAVVLADLNKIIKAKVPHFASLAEFMSMNSFLKEYHEDMKFDVTWGNDISAQAAKTPEKIIEDNQNLANYNTKNFNIKNLSILKTYNNQDGEFDVIDQYPGQLGVQGALFKWFKHKFLPGGKYAQRPTLYVDGDESFTVTGIEYTIGNEISMRRGKHQDFFTKFDAINRFAKSQELITEGEAQLIDQEDDGFACWLITKEPLKTAFLIVANYLPPTEKVQVDGKVDIKIGEEVTDKSVNLPGDYSLKSEFVFDGVDFVENEVEDSHSLHFEVLKPSEFKIYLLSK